MEKRMVISFRTPTHHHHRDYDRDAAKILEALTTKMSGGIFDRLVILLLNYMAQEPDHVTPAEIKPQIRKLQGELVKLLV